MAIRIALMALLLFSGVAFAAPKAGGPVRGEMTIGESKLAVDFWSFIRPDFVNTDLFN